MRGHQSPSPDYEDYERMAKKIMYDYGNDLDETTFPEAFKGYMKDNIEHLEQPERDMQETFKAYDKLPKPKQEKPTPEQIKLRKERKITKKRPAYKFNIVGKQKNRYVWTRPIIFKYKYGPQVRYITRAGTIASVKQIDRVTIVT